MTATQKADKCATKSAEDAEILIAAGDLPNPELVRGLMRAIVDCDYLRNSLLKGTDGTPFS